MTFPTQSASRAPSMIESGLSLPGSGHRPPARQHGRTVFGTLLLAGALLADPARAGLLTDVEKNAMAVAETAAFAGAMITQRYGFAPGSLSFDSTAFTDTAWSFRLSGSYLGQTVDLTFNGSFNPGTDAGNFSLVGTTGTDLWSGPGTWSYVDLAPDTDGLLYDVSVSILTPALLVLDRHIIDPKRELTTDDGTTRHTVSQGKYVITLFGIPVITVDQTDDSIGPSPRDGIATVSVSLPFEHTFLTGSYDQAGGRISGTLLFVPEPSAALLLAGGLGVLVRRRRTVS